MASPVSSRKRLTPDTSSTTPEEIKQLAGRTVDVLSQNLPSLKKNEKIKKDNWLNLFITDAHRSDKKSLEDLAFRLINLTKSSNEEVSLAAHYLCKGKIAKANTIYNLFATSLLISIKFLRDPSYKWTCLQFAEQTGVPKEQLNEMETAFFFNHLNGSAFEDKIGYARINEQLTNPLSDEKSRCPLKNIFLRRFRRYL